VPPARWGGTHLVLRDGLPERWHDALTDKPLEPGTAVPLARLLNGFPVALLVAEDSRAS